MRANTIFSIILSLGLIVMSIYTINTYSKRADATTTKKIVVGIFAVLFIIGGALGAYRSFKTLS